MFRPRSNYTSSRLCKHGYRCFKRFDCKYYHPETDHNYWNNNQKIIKINKLCRDGLQCQDRKMCNYKHPSSHITTWEMELLMSGFPLDRCPNNFFHHLNFYLDNETRLSLIYVSKKLNRKLTRYFHNVFRCQKKSFFCPDSSMCDKKHECLYYHTLEEYTEWNSTNFPLDKLPNAVKWTLINMIPRKDLINYRRISKSWKKLIDLKHGDFVKMNNEPSLIQRKLKMKARRVIGALVEDISEGVRNNIYRRLWVMKTLCKKYGLRREFPQLFDHEFINDCINTKGKSVQKLAINATQRRICYHIDLKQLHIRFSLFENTNYVKNE